MAIFLGTLPAYSTTSAYGERLGASFVSSTTMRRWDRYTGQWSFTFCGAQTQGKFTAKKPLYKWYGSTLCRIFPGLINRWKALGLELASTCHNRTLGEEKDLSLDDAYSGKISMIPPKQARERVIRFTIITALVRKDVTSA